MTETSTWGGAQWLLAAYLIVMTVCPPIFRWTLLNERPDIVAAISAPKAVKTWSEFWYSWSGHVIGRLVLTLILRWGGFW